MKMLFGLLRPVVGRWLECAVREMRVDGRFWR